MSASSILARLRPWMLPLAMVIGLLAHDYMDALQFLAPWLIFAMLLVTFCKIDMHHFSLDRLSWCLLAVQIPGALVVYGLIQFFDVTLAQGAMICVLCPTATAAPVITAMLGGNLNRLISFSLLSNFAVALIAPLLFSKLMPSLGGLSFVEEFLQISAILAPLILGPIAVAFCLRAVAPRVHSVLAGHQTVSFYIWAFSLIIVVGRAVSFVMAEPVEYIPRMIALAVLAGLMCVAQFFIGRRLGHRFGDPVAGAQGLGQKNTVLAVWMALSYLDPVSSVAPAAYIAWQNSINALQIYLKSKKTPKT